MGPMLMGPFFVIVGTAMRFGTSLLVTMVFVWCVLVATVAARRQSPAAPRETSLTSTPRSTPSSTAAAPSRPADPATASADYVGSNACRRCHEGRLPPGGSLIVSTLTGLGLGWLAYRVSAA